VLASYGNCDGKGIVKIAICNKFFLNAIVNVMNKRCYRLLQLQRPHKIVYLSLASSLYFIVYMTLVLNITLDHKTKKSKTI